MFHVMVFPAVYLTGLVPADKRKKSFYSECKRAVHCCLNKQQLKINLQSTVEAEANVTQDAVYSEKNPEKKKKKTADDLLLFFLRLKTPVTFRRRKMRLQLKVRD